MASGENAVVPTVEREKKLSDVPVSAYVLLGEDVENAIISQAGDIGDGELSKRGSPRVNLRFSMDRGVAFSVPHDLRNSCDLWPREAE